MKEVIDRAREVEDIVDTTVAQLTPDRARELVRFMVDMSVATMRAGQTDPDGSMPEFIENLGASHRGLLAALKELRINANRLCDRNTGGTYEDDCRRSLKVATDAIANAEALS